jgi:general secretion pathway protein G
VHLELRLTGQRAKGEGQNGYTFVEVAIVAAIIAVLASAALPLAKVTMQRQRELELRRSLREIRLAIDKYKDAVDQNLISPNDIDNDAEGYPPTLQTLVDGVTPANDTTGRKLRYLRRIPYDPMTRSVEWGLRSSRDEPDARSWGGQNVYDVYTKFEGRGLDGTNYRDW